MLQEFEPEAPEYWCRESALGHSVGILIMAALPELRCVSVWLLCNFASPCTVLPPGLCVCEIASDLYQIPMRGRPCLSIRLHHEAFRYTAMPSDPARWWNMFIYTKL
jgi:hypothetical protein